MQNFNEKVGTVAAAAAAAAKENLFEKSAGNFSGMSDEKLYELCQQYGERARMWRQKFAGLLPEVFKRRLFEKKSFGSIFEFAAKLGGMSEKQVRRVLNLKKKFEAAPILEQLLENGEISVNKLARIASVVTPENQLFWAAQAKILPQSALETLVRDEKLSVIESEAQQSSQEISNGATAGGMQDGLFEPKNDPKSVRAHRGLELNLSPEVQKKLLVLQQKGIDINSLLLEFLEKRDLEIAQKKEKLSAEAKPTNSPYLRAKVRAVMKEEYCKKCSIKTCAKPAEHVHHSQRYSLSKIHDPKYLAPLCKEHHTIAHSIDIKFHEALNNSRRSWKR